MVYSRASRHRPGGIAAIAILTASCAVDSPPAIAPPVTVVAGGASNPTVAVGSSGQAWVAWVDSDVERADVWLARTDDARSFEGPVRVNDIEGDAAPHEQAPAQVEVGPEGNLYVVWQNNTAAPGRMYPYSDLRFARSTDGGRTFEPAIFVNDDAVGAPSSHTFHDVAVAPDGTIYVSWIDSRVRAAIEREQMGEASGGHSGHGDPQLPGPEIRVARSVDGGRTFEPSVVVARDACPCCRTALAIAADGTIYLTWRTVLTGNIRDVVVARSEDRGATFTAANRVHEDGWVFDACPHAGATLAVDGGDRLHVAWYTGTEGEPGIRSAISIDGGATFGSAMPVLTGEWVPPSQVKLAADADGGMSIAWDDRRSGTPELAIARIDPATGAIEGRPATFPGGSPAIASAAGFTAIAWLDGDAVRFTRMATGTRNP